MVSVRLATRRDADACLEIYRPVVDVTVTSFEAIAPEPATFGDRLVSVLRDYPWLVSVDDGAITGYAYACEHRGRAAYRWCVEVSAYVAQSRRRTGVGQTLYNALFACLRHQGFVNAYAGIALPNTASVAFHESLGFEPVGVYRRIGYKLGEWRDVGWWSLRLGETEKPGEPRPLAECRGELTALLEDRTTGGGD